MDRWIGECVPCGIQQDFDTQDQAIDFVEKHVYTKHLDVKPEERCRQYMGHVQFRSTNAPPPVPTTGTEGQASPFPSSPGDGAANYYSTPAPDAE